VNGRFCEPSGDCHKSLIHAQQCPGLRPDGFPVSAGQYVANLFGAQLRTLLIKLLGRFYLSHVLVAHRQQQFAQGFVVTGSAGFLSGVQRIDGFIVISKAVINGAQCQEVVRGSRGQANSPSREGQGFFRVAGLFRPGDKLPGQLVAI
jgi:hypothetical protein